MDHDVVLLRHLVGAALVLRVHTDRRSCESQGRRELRKLLLLRQTFAWLSRHLCVSVRLNCLCQSGETYGFLSGWYFLLSVRYARLISLSVACLSSPRS
jgi:hypothetical protein